MRAPQKPDGVERRAWKRWVLAVYALLLAASHATQHFQEEPPPLPGTYSVMLPSPRQGRPPERLVYLEWSEERIEEEPGGELAPEDRPPVLLIHGSPGRGALFARMAPLIADAGYRVIAVDLPGFGDSSHDIVDRSMRGHAGRMLRFMSELGIERAHVVGWSNGGGVVLHMAGEAPERVASLTMLAAVGDQAMEGSGDYWFEHFKYALGIATFGGVPELLPHFGRMGTFGSRTGFLRNFWESDQRPLRDILRRLEVPMLIIHGRQDCLLKVSAAWRHHELVNNSSLVLLRANHFLPLTHPEQTAEAIVPFLERHDAPGVPEERTVTVIDPDPPRTGVLGAMHRGAEWFAPLHWTVQAGVLAAGTALLPPVGAVAAGWLATVHGVDYLVALVGVSAGLGLHSLVLLAVGPRRAGVSRQDWTRRMRMQPLREGWACTFVPPLRGVSAAGAALGRSREIARFALGRAAGVAVWGIVAYGAALGGMVALYRLARPVTEWKLGLAGAVLLFAAWALPALLTARGRGWLMGRLERVVRYEYWPSFVFYLPLLPFVACLGLKHRGVRVVTCCNPGIENGGGLIGESKATIMRRLGNSACVLPTMLIEQGSVEERAAQVAQAMRRAEISFPIVMKPNAGQRGFAVAKVTSEAGVRAYLERMTAPAVVQPFSPGPRECGVLWARHADGPREGLHGFIFSVTRKEFAWVEGDGARTLEELIYAHPRHRRQAATFLTRLADRAGEVVPAGERVELGMAGNHCQGTLFRDGADLITPQLARAIDALAAGFDGGLDFGRFDLRYRSDEELRRGEGFDIVELNGTMSESTNLYDPDKGLFWAYGVLFSQWRLMFELGASRRRTGAKPIGIGALLTTVWEHYRGRAGSPVSD
jgi:pimeloyl-ACP methyl ester carboxylesterase